MLTGRTYPPRPLLHREGSPGVTRPPGGKVGCNAAGSRCSQGPAATPGSALRHQTSSVLAARHVLPVCLTIDRSCVSCDYCVPCLMCTCTGTRLGAAVLSYTRAAIPLTSCPAKAGRQGRGGLCRQMQAMQQSCCPWYAEQRGRGWVP